MRCKSSIVVGNTVKADSQCDPVLQRKYCVYNIVLISRSVCVVVKECKSVWFWVGFETREA